ncbi:hypothetical protein GGX14DRAFT_654311 [Mycena pura]|uniref:Uncharacterized protein n=1 Tax=Mycena pura TaxID=153505 RepID=A0AAD6V834_9AGAR|nr:hypothetical protein GGX14DRAFT_654311 [Mycena pura]
MQLTAQKDNGRRLAGVAPGGQCTTDGIVIFSLKRSWQNFGSNLGPNFDPNFASTWVKLRHELASGFFFRVGIVRNEIDTIDGHWPKLGIKLEVKVGFGVKVGAQMGPKNLIMKHPILFQNNLNDGISMILLVSRPLRTVAETQDVRPYKEFDQLYGSINHDLDLRRIVTTMVVSTLNVVMDNSQDLTVVMLNDTDMSKSLQKLPVKNRKPMLLQITGICGALHLGLVAMHVAILVAGLRRWEHSLVFPVEKQATVSFWVTALTTMIGTVYGSILVFLAQKTDLRHNWRTHRTLTAAHDSFASWAGLGSALATLKNQLSVPASVLGSFNIVGYLACISVLHITTPAVISVQPFNNTVPVPIGTRWLPEFDAANPNATLDFMVAFPSIFLPWIGNLENVQTLGLFNSSLYEVLDGEDLGNGNADVSALGFNITCGYLPAAINATSDLELMSTNFLDLGPFGSVYNLDLTREHPFTVIQNELLATMNNSIIIYTTRDVLDSTGQKAPPLRLNVQNYFGGPIISGRCLQCSKSLVPQTATVTSPSCTLDVSSLRPNTYKTQSNWRPSPQMDFRPQDLTLVGSDVWSYTLTGPSGFGDTTAFSVEFTNIEDHNFLDGRIHWHILAGGHIRPVAVQLDQPIADSDGQTYNPGIPPELGAGTTILEQKELFLRLEKSKSPIVGSGLLHHICFSQQCAEHLGFIHVVEQPTELNLRIEGWQTIQPSTNMALGKELEVCSKPVTRHKSQRSGAMVKAVTVHHPTNYSRVMCLTLHICLVLGHIILLGISTSKREHDIVFSSNHQDKIIVWTKILATAAGTIYYSVLLYLTQSLAAHSNIQEYCTITTTHDKFSCWAGIGSSLSTLYNQISLPVSVGPALAISAYLLCLSALHVTTPALLSVETFNFSSSIVVPLESRPRWNGTRYNSTLAYVQYVTEFLPWLQNLDESQTPGLFNGSLYDVSTEAYLDGKANASAIGFNITCGYISWAAVESFAGGYNVTLGTNSEWMIVSGLEPDMLVLYNPTTTAGVAELPDSIIGYTANTLLDSDKHTGFPVILPKGDSDGLSVQLFRCSRSLVQQYAALDTGTGTVDPSSLHPNLQKNHSKWHIYVGPENTNTSSNSLLEGDSWATILSNLPFTGMYLNGDNSVGSGDIYLMGQLGLDPALDSISNRTASNRTLYLHDIENAIGSLLASVFWIASGSGLIVEYEPADAPILATGRMRVNQVHTAARLDISLGLGASIVLLILAITFSAGAGTENKSLTSMGLLQTIWVFQHHPELQDIFESPMKITEHSLRVSGLVKVRLSDSLADHWSLEGNNGSEETLLCSPVYDSSLYN